jgi:hypothetical protein
MSEQSFVLVHCFHEVEHTKLKACFSSITMVTVVTLSHKEQKLLLLHVTLTHHYHRSQACHAGLHVSTQLVIIRFLSYVFEPSSW